MKGIIYLPQEINNLNSITQLQGELASYGYFITLENAETLARNLAEINSLEILIIVQNDFAELTSFEELVIEQLEKNYQQNLSDTVSVVDQVMPALKKGQLKRICYLSYHDLTITNQQKNNVYYGDIIHSSVAMFMANFFNQYRPQGFTVRMLSAATGWNGLAEEIVSKRSDEAHDFKHSDENRFVQRNSLLEEIPW